MNKILSLTLVILFGCSSFSKKECENTNWHHKAIEDVNAGNLTTVFAEYSKECSEFGIKINQDQYTQGYKEGLRNICTPSKGLIDGSNGDAPHNLCEEYNKKEYLNSFKKGLSKYCTLENGMIRGREGKSEYRYCNQIGQTFELGYIEGFKQYDRLREINKEKKAKQALDNELQYQKKCSSNEDCITKDDVCVQSECLVNKMSCSKNEDCYIRKTCKTYSKIIDDISVDTKICQ